MYQQMKKGLMLLCTVLLFATCIPLKAQAAADPVFTKTYTVFSENGTSDGVYKIKVKNVKKGYILRWNVTKKGKKYATLSSKRIVAKSKTVTNELTIDSQDDPAFASGKPVRVKVNVYSAQKQLLSKLSFDATLQRSATAIDINTSKISNISQLTPGNTYQFQAAVTPANATSSVIWQVKDAAGADHSSEITASGKWTPTQEGDYTVTAYAIDTPGGEPICTKTVQASVGCYIESVNQSASNGVHVTFGSDASKRYKDTDFSIRSGEASILIKKVKYSEDGKTAYLTTATNFMNGMTYTVACLGNTMEFTASMGEPTALSITTTTAQCEKYTTIKYALLDAKGINVTDNANGAFTYSANINNGFLDHKTGRLYMTTIGSVGTITMNYTSADGKINLTDTKVIVCVAPKAEVAETTNFTITNSVQEPLYKEEDVRTVTVGDTMYAHFQGLDEDDVAITYDSITYQSSDPDKLIISQDGKITPIKTGPVMVVVTAKQGNDSVTYPYSITVKDQRYLATIQMEKTSIAMSNSPDMNYQAIIGVAAYDQYGEKYPLVDEVGILSASASQLVQPSYNSENNIVTIRAQNALSGMYSFTLTLTSNNHSASQNFSVLVSTTFPNSTSTYQVECNTNTMDLSVNENTSMDRTLQVRLAEYRGGVFYQYHNFTKARITKGSNYYTQDLSNASTVTTSAIELSGADVLNITPITLTAGVSNALRTCNKAEPGIYTVTFTYKDKQYKEATARANFTITDGQFAPEYTIQNTTTELTVTNALDMVKSCIRIPDGTILDCTATGTRLTGSQITVRSGEQLHIDTITVQSVIKISTGEDVYVKHTIPVDRTLTNR